MGNIYIHAGLPRTATTSIQKHLLPKSKNKLVFQKYAYSSSVKVTDRSRAAGSATTNSLLKKLATTKPPLEDEQRRDYLREVLLFLSTQPYGWSENDERAIELEAAKEAGLRILLDASNISQKDILISTERLVDTASSLFCKSKPMSEKEYPVSTLAKAIKKYSNSTPCIIICLRDPITYLRSKYCRTTIHRRHLNERELTPDEYIQKQAILETNHPGTSVLRHATHSLLIKQLQEHAFVKAIGFQELLSSDDVFSLMGLAGEDRYSFRDFPKENKLSNSKKQEREIEIKISRALQNYGFYELIKKHQMFD